MDIEKYGTAADIDELLAVRDRIEELAGVHVPADGIGPRADLLDVGDAYQLVLEVPGVTQANIEIALQGADVVVAGIREPHTRQHDVLFSERPNGPFQRTVRLPGKVEREHATAHLESGLLIVTLPKA